MIGYRFGKNGGTRSIVLFAIVLVLSGSLAAVARRPMPVHRADKSAPSGISDYTLTTFTGASIVPGTDDVGNHCDDCTTPITLPFPVQFYDQMFTGANVSSNGTLQFTSDDTGYNICLPDSGLDNIIAPDWADLYTVDTANGQGVFTSVSGTTPNQIFNIEWRAVTCCDNGQPIESFEVRLYESENRIDFVYGHINLAFGIGVQLDTGSHFTALPCHTLPDDGTQYSFTIGPAPTPPPPTPTPSPCVLVPSGLLSWWPANGNPADITGGNAGTLQGGASFAPGEVGQAFSFDGDAANYVEVGDPENLKPSNGITLDAWIYLNSYTSYGGIITKWGQGVQDNWSMWAYDDQHGAGIQLAGSVVTTNGGSFLVGGSIPIGAWTHVAITYDSATHTETIYVNGVSVGSDSSFPPGSTIIGTDADVCIGRECTFQSRPFPGLIDEVEVFDRALGQQEIQTIYNAGGGGKCPPVLYAATGSQGVGGALFKIDPSNARRTFVAVITNAHDHRPIGLTGLDFDPLNGVLYGVTPNNTNNDNTVTKSLVEINPFTGVAGVIGSLGRANSDISFQADGTLFGFQAGSGSGSNPAMTTINLNTGAATPIGNSGVSSTNGGGLAFDPAGTLYLSATGNSGTLDTLDPSTGTRTVGPSISGGPFGSGDGAMAFNGATLFGLDASDVSDYNTHLVTINTSTGVITDIGRIPGLTDALAVAPAVLPTPTPTPTPKPRPTPGSTPTPTPRPRVTPKPSPSASPTPTPTPRPSSTPKH